MPQSQMNIRIDDALKRQGDAIFQTNGFTPSTAVRALYEATVARNAVPSFMNDANGVSQKDTVRESKEGAGLAWKMLGMPVPNSVEANIEEAKMRHALQVLEQYGL